MSIIDELAEVIEYETSNRAMAERIARAVLDLLAAKAGDVRGMLPRINEAADSFTIGCGGGPAWPAGIAGVLDLCAERIAPIVGALRGEGQTFRVRAGMPEPDEPIADPAERAKAVAEELRSRGFDAQVVSGCEPAVLVPMFRNWNMRCLVWERFDMTSPRFKTVGPKGIADSIQRAKACGAMRRGDEAKMLEDAIVDTSDMPIDDPAERAKAVAKILRGRGIWGACVFPVSPHIVYIPAPIDALDPSDEREPRLQWRPYGVWSPRFGGLGPRAIADEIQAEEVRRAQEWAGDE